MTAVDDYNVYDFKREGSIDDYEHNLESLSIEKNENASFFLECEELVSKKDYILNSAGSFRNDCSKLAFSLSNHQTVIYDLMNDKLQKVKSFNSHDKTITNTRFAKDRDVHLFTSSLDGTVKLWDLRTKCQLSHTYSDGTVRPITCFDTSCDGRFICAGTEVIGGTAFLLFWDVRSTKLLGGYWESHVEDLTQIEFLPNKKSRMITGGMDGLINIFDINKSCEDEALIDSLNTENSVDKLGWLQNGSDTLYCLTHSGDFQLWKLTDSSPSIQFSRQNIAKAFNIKYSDNLYTVNVHVDNKGNCVLLGGSNLGIGNCLRSIIVNQTLNSPRSFIGNKQIVRSSLYDSQNEILITAGEKGIVNVWKTGQNSNRNNKIKNHSNKSKSKRLKPY